MISRILLLLCLLNLVSWFGLDGALRKGRAHPAWRAALAGFFLFEMGCLWLYYAPQLFPFYCRPGGILNKTPWSLLYIWNLLVLPLVTGGVLLRAAWEGGAALVRLRKQPPSPPPAPETLSRRRFIGLAGAGIGPAISLGLTGIALQQLDRFRVRRLDLPIPGLPPALDGLKIAHVSDIHVGRFTEGPILGAITRAVNDLDADLVLFTGDLINYFLSDLPDGIATLQGMKSRYGTWLIEGNHDLMEGVEPFRQQVRAAGLRLLVDEAADLRIGGQPVQLLGLRWAGGFPRHADPAHPKPSKLELSFRRVLPLRRPDAFPILLCHHPDGFDLAAEAGIPLTLSGHTHGGQLMLTREIGMGPLFFRYWSGLYEKGGSRLVVSNGTGSWFPLRANAPAEIAAITLRRA